MDAMDLLAVIHRDGGHHTSDVGVEQSVLDAIQIIHEMRGLSCADDIEVPCAAKQHMDACRAEAGVPDDDVLFAWIVESRQLLREVIGWHADPESPDYNDCDKAKCAWCEHADKVLGEPKNGPG